MFFWQKNIQQPTTSLKSLTNEKPQYDVLLKGYWNTHSFYFVDEFLVFKKDSIFLKVFCVSAV
jgi:hypothetical protein